MIRSISNGFAKRAMTAYFSPSLTGPGTGEFRLKLDVNGFALGHQPPTWESKLIGNPLPP